MGFLFEASESDHCLQVPLGMLLPGGPHANWALRSTSPASCASQSLLFHLSLLFPCTAEGGRSLAVRGRFLRPLPPSISLCSGVGGGVSLWFGGVPGPQGALHSWRLPGYLRCLAGPWTHPEEPTQHKAHVPKVRLNQRAVRGRRSYRKEKQKAFTWVVSCPPGKQTQGERRKVQ